MAPNSSDLSAAYDDGQDVTIPRSPSGLVKKIYETSEFGEVDDSLCDNWKDCGADVDLQLAVRAKLNSPNAKRSSRIPVRATLTDLNQKTRLDMLKATVQGTASSRPTTPKDRLQRPPSAKVVSSAVSRGNLRHSRIPRPISFRYQPRQQTITMLDEQQRKS